MGPGCGIDTGVVISTRPDPMLFQASEACVEACAIVGLLEVATSLLAVLLVWTNGYQPIPDNFFDGCQARLWVLQSLAKTSQRLS